VSGFKMLNEFVWPAEQRMMIKDKKKKAFEPILNIRFLLGWRTRHQAKTVTNNLRILSVLALGKFKSHFLTFFVLSFIMSDLQAACVKIILKNLLFF
jgi:hypothetical protein